IEKIIAGFTDKIIALTQLEKDDFVRFKVADAGKIKVIYQGLELEKYLNVNPDKLKVKRSLGLDLDGPVIGMVGRLEPVKGPDYFVEAASFVLKDNPAAKFVLAGEGSLRKKLEARAGSLGLKGKFLFTGWREDIPEIISVLDILVLASLNEAVGIVLIEAQAEGVPVVAAAVGGVPEIVKDKETGILVPSKNAPAIAEAVNYLLKDPEKMKSMGEKAKEWVGAKFGAPAMVNNISSLYRDTLEIKAKPD
ncbi:MAG: glycosyltransferase family 4 protein, partial [Candidatus Omnitrophica bacterium]|nr:glycosyltransferase family 4 protein [Candidatus Omnitrophota bacterium]